MKDWKEYRVGEIAKVKNGFAFKSKDFVTKGVPVLKIKNVKPGTIKLNDLSYVPLAVAKSASKFKIKRGDILITMSGNRIDGSPDSWVGKVAMFKKQGDYLLNQRVGIIDVTSSEIDPVYLTYVLSSNQYQNHFINKANSSGGQANISPDIIHETKFRAPDLTNQISIAEILSSLDDKIELNNEISSNLGALAKVLFKQWFIDFEFPNEEGKPYKSSGGVMVESELGEIPKGWEVLELSAVTEKITDGAHSSPQTTESGLPMASVKDMTAWGITASTCRRISPNDFKVLTQQGCRPNKGDILIAKDGSFLKHSFVVENQIEIVLLSSIAILRPNGRFNAHLLNFYLKEKSVRDRLDMIVSGAVIQRIVLKDFRKFKVVAMPIHLQKAIMPSIESLIGTIWSNNRENEHLSSLRDQLLPKLISGEIEVSQTEMAM